MSHCRKRSSSLSQDLIISALSHQVRQARPETSQNRDKSFPLCPVWILDSQKLWDSKRFFVLPHEVWGWFLMQQDITNTLSLPCSGCDILTEPPLCSAVLLTLLGLWPLREAAVLCKPPPGAAQGLTYWARLLSYTNALLTQFSHQYLTLCFQCSFHSRDTCLPCSVLPSAFRIDFFQERKGKDEKRRVKINRNGRGMTLCFSISFLKLSGAQSNGLPP